ncbi:MAG TPA: LemA family protein [Burkholderiaceae bacterium]|nr:LemA family protein [Burkholderiaceae bacterium]
MTTTQIVGCVLAAVLLFWAVGAYNRLVRLRAAIVRQFAPVDAQFRARHALLLQLTDALAPVLTNAASRIEALRAACGQVEAACAQAKLRPGATGKITSLRLADEILAEARARLPVQSAPGSELAALNAQLQASDATLAFARRQFDAAVIDYNHAVQQFPTLLLVGLFGFRPAATL